MHNYNKKNIKNIENIKNVNNIFQIKKDRTNKTHSIDTTYNKTNNLYSMVNRNFPTNGYRRKEMNDEKLYGYSNKESSNIILEKENMIKNKVHNNNSSINIKKKNYYEKINTTNKDEKEFIKQKSTVLNEHMNKNYVDKIYGDSNNVEKDRFKLRRIGYHNEENSLKMDSKYGDASNVVANNKAAPNMSGETLHRKFNEFKVTTGAKSDNNSEAILKSTNASSSQGTHIQKTNYENFSKKNLMHPKSKNDNNQNYNYSKLNRKHNKYGNPEFRDHSPQGLASVGGTGLSTQGGGATAGAGVQVPQHTSYVGRDKIYQRNSNEQNCNSNVNIATNGKGNYKNDALMSKDKKLSEENFIESKKMNEKDAAVGLGNNEFRRNNNMSNNKGVMINPKFSSTSFLSKEQSSVTASKMGANHNKFNDDINVDHERANNNYIMKQHNPNVKRNMYTNYMNSTKNDTNMCQHKYVVDKDGDRKKEYQKFSQNAVDVNYSHQNVFDRKFGSKFIDSHMKDRKEGNKENMTDLNVPLDETKFEGKKYPLNSDGNNGNAAIVSDRFNPSCGNEVNEYDPVLEYNQCSKGVGIASTSNCGKNTAVGNNNKQPFIKDINSGGPSGSGNSNFFEKQRYFDREDVNASVKNYEYKKNDSGNYFPEFDNNNTNVVICEGRNGNRENTNEAISNLNSVNMTSGHRTSRGNVDTNTHNMRDKNQMKNINPYNKASKYDEIKEPTKFSNNVQGIYKNKKAIKYNHVNDEVDNRYSSSDVYHNNNNHFYYENMNDNMDLDPNEYTMIKDHNYAKRKMINKHNREKSVKRPYHDTMMNYTRDNKKNSSYAPVFKNYTPDYYDDMEITPDMNSPYDACRDDEVYADEGYPDVSYSDMEKHEDLRNYQRSYSHESKSEKGALTIIRLPAENKKQVKKKKKSKVSHGKSLVEMYSTAIPINEKVDSYALKALSKNENLDEKIYALIPKSVVEVRECDGITHVTLQSSSPLFVNQNDNVKQHIITTTHHQKIDDIPNIASCVVPESDESLKESLEKSKESLSGGENDKNLKSIIRGTSLRNKSGSSLSVKFKLSQGEYENKSQEKNENKNMITKREDSDKELNKKIEDHILSEELRNFKIDKNVTERKRASIFDESRTRVRHEKKSEPNNKIVLDSSKVKKATEIKLKKIQHVTGLLEKYDIPNPFEKYSMESIDYSQLPGKNNNAKLMSLALTVSNNYYKYILKSIEKEEIKEVFNEKRKRMILKLIALLGNQINSEIKKKFLEANATENPMENELKKEDNVKPKMSPKEKEIKIEEHNLICKYWEKQSECMSLLIKEWNKISEILESINIDPNNIISSLLSLYGEKSVNDFHLSFDEIKKSNIELDVNIDDISIPNIGEVSENKFDPANITVTDLIKDMNWDMDLEYSLNQIREEWKNENKQSKKLIQKKIVEGIKDRIGLLDYLNKVELNLNAFAKIIEGRMISNDDVKSQLRSMQDLNEDEILSKLLENLEFNKMDINAESFKTPNSFFVSHHLPMTMCTLSDKSKMDDLDESCDNDSSDSRNGNRNGSDKVNDKNHDNQNEHEKNNHNEKNSNEYNSAENQSADDT
ncbi:hypothetical protein, conserved [Plasmodium gonderi]|uniref:Uncharacterized protein n=1 Tax=Plasmodium gonderi TaxID=77519 RepID=A0A1Y1JFJ4_PLAGO|nr:hypothetical protein, conserved [Plasmodium gonderi]GAW81266.1 hypothetical protein, conserved [Plasmodium gonderi]